MSDWHVELTSSAVRDLDRLSPRVLPAVVEFCFGPLATEPLRIGKPLVGELAGLYSARRGDYRVLYEVNDMSHQVVVHRVAHRGDAYRPLQR